MKRLLATVSVLALLLSMFPLAPIAASYAETDDAGEAVTAADAEHDESGDEARNESRHGDDLSVGNPDGEAPPSDGVGDEFEELTFPYAGSESGKAPSIAALSSAADLAEYINGLKCGLVAEDYMDTVTITGTSASAIPIALNLDAGVTAIWNAVYTGSSRRAPIISLSSSGTATFSVGPSGSISNTGTGGAIHIVQTSSAISVEIAGIVSAGTGGNGILVSSDNATVNVSDGGMVASLHRNASAAVQIGSDVAGTVLNISGSVVSNAAGHAISDGSGTSPVPNNTQINIDGGTVAAMSASAVHSVGTDSAVMVSNHGVLSNAATSNLYSTVFMGGNPVPGFANVSATSGGVIQALGTDALSFAVHTAADVVVSGGAISTVNGRGISLAGRESSLVIDGGSVQATGTGSSVVATGADSRITVAGGEIQTTGTGTAISTIGINSRITVNGGTIQVAGTGTAISTTGMNSQITVVGGIVSSVTGSAISASGVSAAIAVSGGAVSAAAGNGIYVSGEAATIEIGGVAAVSAGSGNAIHATGENAVIAIAPGDDPAGYSFLYPRISAKEGTAIYATGENAAVNIGGGQIYAYKIPASGDSTITTTGLSSSVHLSDGFIFAYGTEENVNHVVSTAALVIPDTGGGEIAVWNEPRGTTSYAVTAHPPDNSTDLTSYAPGALPTLWWYNHATLGFGIAYDNGTASGMFILEGLSMLAQTGLIFNAANGQMRVNTDGSGNPITNPTLADGTGWSVSGSLWDYSLTLTNFNFTNESGPALVIANSPPTGTTVTLVGNNRIVSLASGTNAASENAPTDSVGIKSGYEAAVPAPITIQGGGTLAVSGGPIDPEQESSSGSYGILASSVYVAESDGSSTITAQGHTQAVSGDVSVDMPYYTYWTNTETADPGGNGTHAGTGRPDAFSNEAAFKYVRIQPSDGISFTASQTGGASGIADSTAIAIRFSRPVAGLQTSDIIIASLGGEATADSLSGTGSAYTLALKNVATEGEMLLSFTTSSPPHAFVMDQDSQVVTIYKTARSRGNGGGEGGASDNDGTIAGSDGMHSQNPHTGDSSTPMIWVLTMYLSVLTCLALASYCLRSYWKNARGSTRLPPL
ncbi:MAG: hypothetical protein FWH32_08380 [Clostridiales bacterium]|nr:hypothetical protein [Clostridiales bacterium]